jgi:hypothetical protein
MISCMSSGGDSSDDDGSFKGDDSADGDDTSDCPVCDKEYQGESPAECFSADDDPDLSERLRNEAICINQYTLFMESCYDDNGCDGLTWTCLNSSGCIAYFIGGDDIDHYDFIIDSCDEYGLRRLRLNECFEDCGWLTFEPWECNK